MVPRVGNRCIDDSEVLQQVQELIPSRTLAPPDCLLKGMAPYRRCVFSERGTGELRAEEDWEFWENLAKRNLIRPPHATRLCLTMFAKPKEASQPDTEGTESIGQDRSSSSGLSAPDSRRNSILPTVPEETEVDLQGNTMPRATEATGPNLTSSQQADLPNPKQSTRFKALPKDKQIALIRAHKNLGHPSPERLSTLLRSQGFRAEIAQAALELKCSTCQAASQPKLARPGSIRDELGFNDRICMDGLEWTNQQGTKFMYTMLWIGPQTSNAQESPQNKLHMRLFNCCRKCGSHGRVHPVKGLLMLAPNLTPKSFQLSPKPTIFT